MAMDRPLKQTPWFDKLIGTFFSCRHQLVVVVVVVVEKQLKLYMGLFA